MKKLFLASFLLFAMFGCSDDKSSVVSPEESKPSITSSSSQEIIQEPISSSSEDSLYYGISTNSDLILIGEVHDSVLYVLWGDEPYRTCCIDFEYGVSLHYNGEVFNRGTCIKLDFTESSTNVLILDDNKGRRKVIFIEDVNGDSDDE